MPHHSIPPLRHTATPEDKTTLPKGLFLFCPLLYAKHGGPGEPTARKNKGGGREEEIREDPLKDTQLYSLASCFPSLTGPLGLSLA